MCAGIAGYGGSGVVRMPVVITQPGWWIDHIEELIEGLCVAATMPDEQPVFDAANSVALDQPGWWAEHPDELRAALRESITLEADAQRWLDIDAAVAKSYDRDRSGKTVRDLLRDAEPPDHPEDRGHGQ